MLAAEADAGVIVGVELCQAVDDAVEFSALVGAEVLGVLGEAAGVVEEVFSDVVAVDWFVFAGSHARCVPVWVVRVTVGAGSGRLPAATPGAG